MPAATTEGISHDTSETGQADHGLSPYLAARQEWNERYGSYIAQAHAWRLTALIALVIAAIATGGLVLIASQAQVVPYVVKVYRLGTAIAVTGPTGRSDRMRP